MHNHRRTWYTWSAALAVIVACACAPLSNVGLPSSDDSSSSADDFPRTSNPIAVHAILDTEHAASNAEWVSPGMAYNSPVDGETSDGTQFYLMMPGILLDQDADGNLIPAFGTVVTVTPVSAIDDIPFSQGYLAAVHIGPEGLLMTMPGTLTLTLPGSYDVSQLIGFAADGTGDDFHLFPIAASSFDDGTTYVSFSPSHFSLYGVALVTLQEIEAQQAHPPVSPASQDEEDLAPLVPIPSDELAPLWTKIQRQLNTSYNRMVKRDLDRLADIPCKKVDVTAYQFEAWMGKVEAANQTEHFQQMINQGAAALLNRLTECARVTCDHCLNNTPGNQLDHASVNSLLVLAAFAGDMAGILGRTEDASYWLRLSDKCAEEAGLPPLGPSGFGDCTGACVTAEPLVCK